MVRGELCDEGKSCHRHHRTLQILLIKYTRTFFLPFFSSLLTAMFSEFDLPSPQAAATQLSLNIENPNFNYGKVLRVNMENMKLRRRSLSRYRLFQSLNPSLSSSISPLPCKIAAYWGLSGRRVAEHDGNGKCETFGKWLLENQLLNESREFIQHQHTVETHLQSLSRFFFLRNQSWIVCCFNFSYSSTSSLSCVQFASSPLYTMLENTMQSSFI